MPFLCWFLHKWVETGNRTRHCARCQLRQTLTLYGFGGADWEDDA